MRLGSRNRAITAGVKGVYGGMGVAQAKQLKALKKENQQLKRLVADLALDKAMLEEVARGNF